MMTSRSPAFPRSSRVLFPLLVLGTALVLLWTVNLSAQDGNELDEPPVELRVMPRYNTAGQLLLPEGYRHWIYAGSSLGLSYSEGSGGSEMFHHTLIEPTAYDHFRRTGEFRQGTMLALLLHDPGEQVLPQRRGRFAGPVAAVEMAVKDSEHSGSETNDWAYYGFGGAEGLRRQASAFAPNACAQCHSEHAAYDNVFLQFYPLLVDSAPVDRGFALARSVENRPSDIVEAGATASDSAQPEAAPELTVVLRGYDPVLLSEGHQELGKPEIVVEHGGWRYQFVSEPTRARFAADPTRFGVQNTTCPVVAGASVDADFFAVHDGRIYLFATAQCVNTFEGGPGAFIDALNP